MAAESILQNAVTTILEADIDFQAAVKGEPGDAEPGSIQMMGSTSVPSGWLECNGAAVSRTAYATLFSIIGTTFGNGDGTTTFNLPDMRGEFPRGWDHGKGIDPAREFGTAQLYQMTSHGHGVGTANSAGNRLGTDTGAFAGGRIRCSRTIPSQVFIFRNVPPNQRCYE